MNLKQIVGLLSVASLPASALGAAQPIELLPSSPWNMDYAAESCRLIRTFGEGSKKITISMEQDAPDDDVILLVTGEPFGDPNPYPKVRFAFGSAASEEQEGLAGTLGPTRQPMFILSSVKIVPGPSSKPKKYTWHPLAPPDRAAEHAADRLTIGFEHNQPITLKTGPMDKPMDAMRTCVDSLIQSWGLDPAIQRSGTGGPEPLGQPSDWIRDGDYPTKALAFGDNGIVRFRLMVDANGIPTACIVQSRTKPDDFGELVCKIVSSRARFKPARDEHGKPMASFFASRVLFRIEH